MSVKLSVSAMDAEYPARNCSLGVTLLMVSFEDLNESFFKARIFFFFTHVMLCVIVSTVEFVDGDKDHR